MTKLFLANPYKHHTLRHFSREGKRGAWESLCFHDGCSLTTWPSSKRADNREAALPTYSFILSKRCWICNKRIDLSKAGESQGTTGKHSREYMKCTWGEATVTNSSLLSCHLDVKKGHAGREIKLKVFLKPRKQTHCCAAWVLREGRQSATPEKSPHNTGL